MISSVAWIFLVSSSEKKKISRFNMLFSYLSSHVFLFQSNFYSSFTTGTASLYLTHHPVIFIVALDFFCSYFLP